MRVLQQHDLKSLSVSWGEFASHAPELAEFGVQRLTAAPAYVATVDVSGAPRVHPVTPVIGDGQLFLFMEPTSPKGEDIARRGVYALHCGVADPNGTGGEFSVRGHGERINSRQLWAAAAEAASYTPQDRYVLFELHIAEARSNGYGDVELPEPRSWRVTHTSA